ncbi:MAG: hypothetical protein ABSH52_35305 [Terriglobia bacterium]|jgi:hypothetical protein
MHSITARTCPVSKYFQFLILKVKPSAHQQETIRDNFGTWGVLGDPIFRVALQSHTIRQIWLPD